MEDISIHLPKLCDSTFEKIEKIYTVGELALNCVDYAKKLKNFVSNDDSSHFMQFLADELHSAFTVQKVVGLNKLREHFIVATNRLFNQQEFTGRLKDMLLSMEETNSAVLNFFLGSFLTNLSEKVLIFVCERMQNSAREVSRPAKRSGDDFSSLEFQRTVHYIAGSVIAGILRRERRYPSFYNQKPFGDILRENFLEKQDDPSTCCSDEVRMWTAAQDRGRLCYVNKTAFQFYMELVCVVMGYEEEDGSILLEKVHEGVRSNFELYMLWDSLLGSVIPEDQALQWFVCTVDTVCRTVTKGIMKRRLNEAIKKPVSSVSHRSRLAR